MRVVWLCWLIALSGELSAQDNDALALSFLAVPSTVSSFEGSRAVIEITDVERWQKLLDINSNDLEELRMLRSGKQIDEKIKKIGVPEKRIELEQLRELLVKQRLTEILDPRQLALRRVLVLREKYSSPIALFDKGANLLLELGMSQEQFDELRIPAYSKNREIRSMVNDLVMETLNEITQKISADTSNRMWALFGRDFRSLPRSEFPWHQIQVLPKTDPKRQLMFASMLVLDDDLKLTHPQLVDIFSLQEGELLSAVNRSSQISAELDRILSKLQRSAIVQGMQRNMLVEDMTVLISQEVITYLKLEKDEVKSIEEIVRPATKRIREFRIEKQLGLLRNLVSRMPNDFQKKLTLAVEGVWQ
jgi:hypothetical protein